RPIRTAAVPSGRAPACVRGLRHRSIETQFRRLWQRSHALRGPRGRRAHAAHRPADVRRIARGLRAASRAGRARDLPPRRLRRCSRHRPLRRRLTGGRRHMTRAARSLARDASPWPARYRDVRARTLALTAPLSAEDCALQSMPDASPAKWHLAHTTWFFETFVAAPHDAAYRPFDPAFRVLFNSYYNG